MKYQNLASSFQTEYDTDEPDTNRKPYLNLLASLLERAIRDAIGTCETSSQDRRDAKGWLHSEATHAFSFSWVVEELQLSSKFIRKIKDWIPLSSKHRAIPHGIFFPNSKVRKAKDSKSSHNSNGLHRVYSAGQK